MGTHGRGGVSHMLLGSIAEKVVRRAPCPVLTVRHPQREFVETTERRRVAYCIGNVTVTTVPPDGGHVDVDRAAMALDDAPRRGQAEAGAAVLRGEERLEDLRPHVRRDARAVVGDRDRGREIVGRDR